ncbi:Uncharacterised protein [Acetobacterium wieringae]|uniref:hypothetical protein n=1 Tax=Acetobacterium wieringae TaxID=52694 RepID=UPI001DBA575B|nr:hypothetical protein [Acetobacterium wieringae]VUZ27856.1 Uncharacterised protein [Acetobacterium wieringae]
MTFQKIEDALVSVTDKTYRSFAPEGEEPPYIVWDDDDNQNSLYGGGKLICQVIEGTIDLYTKDHDDPMFDQIQKGLNDAGIGYKYNSKQTEEETELTHYEWVWVMTKVVE